MAEPNTSTKPIYRADSEIQEEIWQAMWKEETIRAVDIHDISVDVENGQACLSGHVSKEGNVQRIADIAWSVPGIIAVHNHLVSDHDLSLQIAQALGDDECTRLYVIPVCSFHGWVMLGGRVPDRHIQRAAEAAAASVPAVRGVILLPDIPGEPVDPPRNSRQPRIGVRVYGEDETEGTVYQVVINPKNRLVTHAIVRVNQPYNDRHLSRDYLVPAEDMYVVGAEGIFLGRKAKVLSRFPVFNPAHYIFAPLTWQPPYPYAVGSVRWPRKEQGTATNAFIAAVQGKINRL